MSEQWDQLKLRTKLYAMKCCPSCASEDLFEKATGPTWTCNKCCVSFMITNPSYLKRKKRESKASKKDSRQIVVSADEKQKGASLD